MRVKNRAALVTRSFSSYCEHDSFFKTASFHSLRFKTVLCQTVLCQTVLCKTLSCFLLLSSIFFLSVDSFAQAATPKAEVQQAVIDFGAALQGDEVSREFKVVNQGTAPLVIDRVSPTCGCTAVVVSGNTINPGESAVISAKINTTGFSGNISKDVRVFTNDPLTPTLILTLKGVVGKFLKVEPERVIFSDLVKEELTVPPFKEVSITLASDSDGEITDIVPQGSSFSIQSISKTKKSASFKIVLDRGIPTTDARERIVVKLSGVPLKEFNIPVVLKVKSPYLARPATVSFGLINEQTPKADLQRKVQFSSNIAKKISIKRVFSDTPGVIPSFSVVKEGSIFDILIELNPKGISGIMRAAVKVELDVSSGSEATLGSNAVSNGNIGADLSSIFTIPVFAMGSER